MKNFFKDLFKAHADRCRYLFGVGSAWSIIIPVVIVAVILLNAYAVSRYQYDSSDLRESYWDGYGDAEDEHAGDYDSGYNSGYDAGFEESCEISYDEGYSKAESEAKKTITSIRSEAFSDGYHRGFQDGSGDHSTGIVSEEEFLGSYYALQEYSAFHSSD